MRSADVHDRVYDMLRQGMTRKQVIASFPNQPERTQAASVLSTLPDPKELRRHRWGTRSLISFCGILAVGGAISVVNGYSESRSWNQWVFLTAGNLGLVYGFLRRRFWAYAGFPLWVVYMFLGDLKALGPTAPRTEAASGTMVVVFYSIAGVFAWVAYRIRKRMYPYAELLGPRRERSGQLAILADLERPAELYPKGAGLNGG